MPANCLPSLWSLRARAVQSQVIHSGKPLIVNDLQKQVRTASRSYYVDENNIVQDAADIPEGEQVSSSALIVPVMLAGKTVGAIQVFSYQKDAFTQTHLRVLQAMASQIAVASNNALLYQKAQSELAERQKLQAALEEERNLLAPARGRTYCRVEGCQPGVAAGPCRSRMNSLPI